MTLCQHGVQEGAGYECSACVTTPEPHAEPNAAALLDLAALRLWLFDLNSPADPHIAVRLDRIEQYLRSEKR